MVEMEIKYLFTRSDGGSFTLTQPNAGETASDVQITQAGQGIVTSGLFEPDGYTLTEYMGAQKIVTTTTDVPITEE